MTWEEVLKRDDIVGGDIETHDRGYVYRGPISAIQIDGGSIRIKSPWRARMPEDMSESWRKWDIVSCFVSPMTFPSDIGDGRVHFSMQGPGFGVIFPKGGSRLDPTRVEGLEIKTSDA